MDKINPFNPNSVVAPSLFAGRSAQVDDVCKKLSQLQHGMPASFFIHGERGIGKTALAKLINFIATSPDDDLYNLNLLTSYYSVEKSQDISGVLQESLNKLTDKMDKTLLEQIGGKLGKLLKNGKFEIGAFGVGTIAIEASAEERQKFDITVKDQTVSILSNILKALKTNETMDQTGILIIIDEIHNLGDIQGAASIFRNIATSLDFEGLGNVSFLLIGYKEDATQFFSVDSSARRTFDVKPLGVMPDQEAAEVLRKGFKVAKVEWDEDLMLSNIKVAGGYPHSIQILGHNLIEADRDDVIDQQDWSDVIMRTAIELQDKDFSTMYTFRKKQTVRDKLLAFLAQEKEPLTRKYISKNAPIKNIYRCINDLKKIGAIREDDDANIFLQSQLFRVAILFDLAMRRISEGDSDKRDHLTEKAKLI